MLGELTEQIPHAPGALPNENLVELRTGRVEEGNAGFASDGSRKQCFTGSGRSHQQHSLRELATQVAELVRILEELDDLLEFLLRLVAALDVLERNGDVLRIDLDLVADLYSTESGKAT